MTLTFDLRPWVSNSSEILSRYTPPSIFVSVCQKVRPWECSQTDGQKGRRTDGQTDRTENITSTGNTGGEKVIMSLFECVFGGWLEAGLQKTTNSLACDKEACELHIGQWYHKLQETWVWNLLGSAGQIQIQSHDQGYILTLWSSSTWSDASKKQVNYLHRIWSIIAFLVNP